MRQVNFLAALALLAFPLAVLAGDEAAATQSSMTSTQTITRTVERVVATSTVTSCQESSCPPASSASAVVSVSAQAGGNATTIDVTTFVTSPTLASGRPSQSGNASAVVTQPAAPIRNVNGASSVLGGGGAAVVVACLAGALSLVAAGAL